MTAETSYAHIQRLWIRFAASLVLMASMCKWLTATFAQIAMDQFFVSSSVATDVCGFLTSFSDFWNGDRTAPGNSLMIWNGAGVTKSEREMVLAIWSKALHAHFDHQTNLVAALRDKRVNQLGSCSFRLSLIERHWGNEAECLVSQPSKSDMLHLLIGRKPCSSDCLLDARCGCFEKSFMYKHELKAAARSGRFFAIQVWAIYERGLKCKEIMPIILHRVNVAHKHAQEAKFLWEEVKYMACDDAYADRPPSNYEPQKPAGDCFPMPFGIEPSAYAVKRCRNADRFFRDEILP